MSNQGSASNSTSTLNINIGILGHVDSGKTSLVKALSTCLSTAALDKHPQSIQRGITLDLGFSSFTLNFPDRLKSLVNEAYNRLQFTLVDCPGHASLIRTIIGGAQIIDLIILVIDINKGIQTQTAECIVIAEITTDNMIIVLNKIDLIPEEIRYQKIERQSRRLRKIFASTKFHDCPIIHISAAVGGEKVAALAPASHISSNNRGTSTITKPESEGIESLVILLQNTITIPHRNPDKPFYFAIDHCFPIKGHGTVLTGTILSGSISVNNTLEIPNIQTQRKVKSMQMFRAPIKYAKQGDRVGICVTNLDSKLIERSIAAAPGTVPLLSSVICLVRKVRFFRRPCKSNEKFHITVGHTTVVGMVQFYGAKEIHATIKKLTAAHLNTTATTITPHSSVIVSDKTNKGTNDTTTTTTISSNSDAVLNPTYLSNFPSLVYDWEEDFEVQEELYWKLPSEDGVEREVAVVLDGNEDSKQHPTVPSPETQQPLQWALIHFQQPVFCPIGSLIIGSRLDGENPATTTTNTTSHECRLSFYGPIKESLLDNQLEKIRVFKWKQKEAQVHRLIDVRQEKCFSLIGWHLVGAGSGLRPFIGMKVVTKAGDVGVIVSPFGTSGKFQVKFELGARDVTVGSVLYLKFKRFIHDPKKRMVQSGSWLEVNEASKVEEEEEEDGDDDDDEGVEAIESVLEGSINMIEVDGNGVGEYNPSESLTKSILTTTTTTTTIIPTTSSISDIRHTEREPNLKISVCKPMEANKFPLVNASSQLQPPPPPPPLSSSSNPYYQSNKKNEKQDNNDKKKKQNNYMDVSKSSVTVQAPVSVEKLSYPLPPPATTTTTTTTTTTLSLSSLSIDTTNTNLQTKKKDSQMKQQEPWNKSIINNKYTTTMRNAITVEGSANPNPIPEVTSTTSIASSPRGIVTPTSSSSSVSGKGMETKDVNASHQIDRSNKTRVAPNGHTILAEIFPKRVSVTATIIPASTSTTTTTLGGTVNQGDIRRGKIESLKEPIPTPSIAASSDGCSSSDCVSPPSSTSSLLYSQAIVSGAFRMEENIRALGPIVAHGPDREPGVLLGPYAKLGKCRVSFPSGIVGPIGGLVELFLTPSLPPSLPT